MTRRLAASWVDLGLSILPVLAVGALAAWSYWLVRTTPGATEAAPVTRVSKLPDLTLGVFHADSYDEQGRLTSRVEGERGWHHPSDDSMEVEVARVWSQRERDGQMRVTTAQAQHLWVNGEQTQYRLSGDAQVVQPPASAEGLTMSVAGDELFIDDGAKQVSSAKPVVLHQGDRVLRGNRMHYDQNTEVLELKGQVSAWRPASGS